MDCKTARLLLDFHRPHPAELPPDDHDALEAHLAGCPDCDAAARADRQLDAVLGPAVRNVPVPDGLRDRIRARLGAERGDRHTRWVGWAVRVSAAAAALLLAAWLAWAWLRPHHVENFDVVALREGVALKHHHPSPEKVNEWFEQEHGVATAAPTDFRYELLAHYDLARCQGQRVPMLLFTNGQDRAFVYVVTKKQFNVDDLLKQPKQESGGYTVVVREAPAQELAYVVVYTGDSLRPFLHKNTDQPTL